MSEENENNDDGITIVSKIIHEIRDTRAKPKKHKSKIEFGNEQQSIDEGDNKEWFEDFKKNLAEKAKPEFKQKILDAQSGYEIEGILQDAKEDREQPYKAPAGKAKLPTQPDYSKSEGDLINRLYGQAKTRDRKQQEQKQDALEKIDRMYKSLTENPNLGRKVKSIGDSLGDFNSCPKCGSVVNANFNRKGSVCPICNFESGKGSYVRRY